MSSPAYGDQIRARITDDTTHGVDYYGPAAPPLRDAGTSHTSVLAPDGGAVAITSTINTP